MQEGRTEGDVTGDVMRFRLVELVLIDYKVRAGGVFLERIHYKDSPESPCAPKDLSFISR